MNWILYLLGHRKCVICGALEHKEDMTGHYCWRHKDNAKDNAPLIDGGPARGASFFRKEFATKPQEKEKTLPKAGRRDWACDMEACGDSYMHKQEHKAMLNRLAKLENLETPTEYTPVKPKPFLRPAFEKAADAMCKEIVGALKKPDKPKRFSTSELVEALQAKVASLNVKINAFRSSAIWLEEQMNERIRERGDLQAINDCRDRRHSRMIKRVLKLEKRAKVKPKAKKGRKPCALISRKKTECMSLLFVMSRASR